MSGTPTNPPHNAPPASAPSGPSFASKVGSLLGNAFRAGVEVTKRAMPFIFKTAVVTIGAVILTHGPAQTISRIREGDEDGYGNRGITQNTIDLIAETAGFSRDNRLKAGKLLDTLVKTTLGFAGLSVIGNKLSGMMSGGKGHQQG